MRSEQLKLPVSTREMELKEYLRKKKEAVEAFFGRYFGEATRPQVLQDAMLYSLRAGGKRIRPILAIASYETCGGKYNIIPYAATLELIHTYSLIHDDLPAMDNDDLRRGKPCNHKIYGEAVAILAGDALLTEAFQILSDHSFCPEVKQADLLRAGGEIARAAGMRGMVAGQVQDMLSETEEPDADTLSFIHIHKTAALISASVKVGAILAGCDKERLDALSSYGNNIGHAFQVIDDILDVEGSTEELGKKAGQDEKIQKMTYPRLYGIEGSRKIARDLIGSGIAALEIFSSEAPMLKAIAEYLQGRKS